MSAKSEAKRARKALLEDIHRTIFGANWRLYRRLRIEDVRPSKDGGSTLMRKATDDQLAALGWTAEDIEQLRREPEVRSGPVAVPVSSRTSGLLPWMLGLPMALAMGARRR